MKRIAGLALAVCVAAAAIADESPTAPDLTATQVIEKNVAARGGLDAWRKIQTMVWIGHVEAANAPASRMSFILEQKRPNKTRFEIRAQNQLSQRIYDGENGWKMRPSASGKPEVLPFTPEELSFARDGQGIDGPLIDYAAKGVAITLDGVDQVEGRKAYRLNVGLPSGASHHVWIDAQNFLEIKYDRRSRNALGQVGTMSVFYRDYHTIEGLQMPLTIETVGEAAKPERMVIERVALNPPLEDRMFARPRPPGQGRSVTVDTRSPQRQVRPAVWPGSFPFPGAAKPQLQSGAP